MYNYKDIAGLLDQTVEMVGEYSTLCFDKARPIDDADEYSLTWYKSEIQDNLVMFDKTKASFIICSNKIEIPNQLRKKKCFIQCDQPKLLFSNVVNELFAKKPNHGIHAKAVISPDALIGSGTQIGAHTVIDNCTIGNNCLIGCNCHLADNTKVGDNVIIGSSTVIGGNGFGYSREPDGKLILFPHIGGVIIEDNVEIGSNTSIDRGALGNTIIHHGVKIDNMVHIAHNVVIGENALIIAHAMIGGSTHIGQRTWVAPSACLKNGIKIGDDVTVGLGAVVTKNIPEGQTWVGNPAMPLEEFIRLRKKD